MKFIRKLTRVPAPVVLEGLKFDPSDVADLVRCYSFTEVASILGISVKTLRAHVKAGRIRTVQVGTTEKRPRRKIQGYSIQSFMRKLKVREVEPCPSPFYVYDFQVDGRRFYGSTGAKSKREAERVEDDLKRQARSKPVNKLKLTKTVP